MSTWKCEYRGRWQSDYVIDVAAPSFEEAVKKVRAYARRMKTGKRVQIKSIVRTAKLDA